MNTTNKRACDKFHKSNTKKELVTQHFWSTKYVPDTVLGTGINIKNKRYPSFEELSAPQKRDTNQSIQLL